MPGGCQHLGCLIRITAALRCRPGSAQDWGCPSYPTVAGRLSRRERIAEPSDAHLRYSAGVMVLSQEHPRVILHRSEEPVLTPLLPQERSGTVPNVVFPTGIDRRDDLGTPDRFDVYYGMADSRIGVARLNLPEHLPPGAPADGDGPKTGRQE